MITKDQLITAFNNQYNENPTNFYFAPGRINLIGEHTDYNGGHVFPCAISLGTYAAVAPNHTNQWRIYSQNFTDQPVQSFSLADLTQQPGGDWANYVTAMLDVLQKQHHTFDEGLDVLIWGDLPNGAGLSSSASLELLIGTIANMQYHLNIPMLDLIKAGKVVENQYIGVNSGIMDQFAIGMGKANHAILLDTNTLEYDQLPLNLDDNVIVIMNTNKRRELADSKYNERRSECEAALARIQTKFDYASLGAMTEEEFDETTSLINDGTLIKRARHAVFENQRTLRAATALDERDLAKFGRLMNASGSSLAYDYEVTGIELDTLVSSAWQQPGVLGARMTGAGFGGCAIAIVNQAQVDNFTKAVGERYRAVIGYDADFYVAEIADGPRAIFEA